MAEKNNKEFRKIIIDSIETRAMDGQNENMIISGYIAKFNTISQFMGFYETIAPQAFDNTLADGHNIWALYNHDYNKILGSIKTGSLVLEVDNIGLKFELTLNKNISYSNDVYELVKSGEVDGCSFSFNCNDADWTLQEDGSDLRTLLDISISEVTITPFPAYLDTEANARDIYTARKQELNKSKKQKLLLELNL